MVVCVNNLGALSCLEVAVVTKAAIACLGNIKRTGYRPGNRRARHWLLNGMRWAVSAVAEGRGVVVARVMSGSFMTALEMAGVSLTLMTANQETLRLFGERTQFLKGQVTILKEKMQL